MVRWDCFYLIFKSTQNVIKFEKLLYCVLWPVNYILYIQHITFVYQKAQINMSPNK